MAPTLFSLAASRMSRPRIPFKDVTLLIFCKEGMHRHVWRASRQQIKNWKKCKDWNVQKQESKNELTDQSFWRWKKSGHQQNNTLKKHDNTESKDIQKGRTRKETGTGEKEKTSLARNASGKSTKPPQSQHANMKCLRCRVVAPLSFATWLLTRCHFYLWAISMPWRPHHSRI